MLDAHKLGALSTFLEKLTQLTSETGIVLGGHMRPQVEIDGEYLTVDVRRAEDGSVTYALDLEAS